MADSLFSWTCQSPLTKDDTLALIGHLETVTAEADGSLDSVNLSLVMALLYCLDVSFLEQGTEDREGKMNICWILFLHFIYFASNSGSSIFQKSSVCMFLKPAETLLG